MPKTENNKPNWLDDLDISNIEKSAALDIKPAIKVKLNETVVVQIETLPELTTFINRKGESAEYYCMNVKKDNISYQLNCHSKSMRFHLGVLAKKLGGFDKLVGKIVAISKSKGSTREYPNAELYTISLVK